MIKQNEIKVLLMDNVHGGNVHHIYADTELLSARLLIILSMARYSHYLPKSADFNFMLDYSRLSSVLPCDKLHIHFCKYILPLLNTAITGC